MLSRFLVLLALAGTLLVGAPLRAQQEEERRFTIEVDSVPVTVALQGPAVVELEDPIRATIEASFGYGLDLFGSLPDEFADGPYEEIAISVADSGPGIGPEERERIFRPFWSRAGEGTGLGLPIARELAHALGGELVLESQLGKGSRFELRLPAG